MNTDRPAASSFSASVIVRAKNKADTISATLSGLRSQSTPVELIVVDSGSSDGTVEIAEKYADLVLHLDPAEFTYGGALNFGASHAAGDIHFALSAHCVAPDAGWVNRALLHYADGRVAATNGSWSGDLQRTSTPSLDELQSHPRWGFSNHASSWRAEAWRNVRFREDLAACEDKDWSWRVLAAGWKIVFDPALTVSADHRRSAGLRSLYRRTKLESRELARLGAPIHSSGREVASDWWGEFIHPSRFPRWARRASPNRAVEHLGAYAGLREASKMSRLAGT